MLPKKICDVEILFRAINPIHQKKIGSEIRLTSALFKDSKGNSADREGGREEKRVVATFRERFPKNFGLVNITALECREEEANPIADPEETNPFHSLIIRCNGNLSLTRSQARSLVKKCRVLYYPNKYSSYDSG